MTDYVPVIIFCYRRKIDKLINSLLKNKEAKETELFIFSDGFKSEIDKKDVINIRESLKKISGFKLVHIVESDKNKGLANSIIEGTTKVINKFAKTIVLEDDLIVSSHFLDYMNRSLSLYQNKKNIWSISGYSPVIPQLNNNKKEVYLSLRSSSWGWATWADRWNKVDWSINDFKVMKKNKEKIKFFEQGGNDLFKMLELQYLGKIDSWAIRWCYSQFLNLSYSVTPKISMIQNNGFSDGVGVHNFGKGYHWQVKLAESKINDLEASFNVEISNYFKKYHDINFYTRIGYFLRKWGGYDFLKYFSKKF
jgi:hypothetical protein